MDLRRLGLRRFWRDERGTSFEGIALSVSIVAVAFVASADMLDYLAKSRHAAPPRTIAAAPPATLPALATSNLDDMPTASLPKLIDRAVLDPCKSASH